MPQMTPFDPFYKRALTFLLENEGGFVNHPNDSGGPTNHGITIGTLASWRGEPVRPEDVEDLTKEHAGVIYFERYWKPLGCDRMVKLPIATAMLDAGVLFGVHISATRAQRAARAANFPDLAVDGHIGQFSLNALNAVDVSLFLKSFVFLLKTYVERVIETHPKYVVFQKGWDNRIERLKKLNAF